MPEFPLGKGFKFWRGPVSPNSQGCTDQIGQGFLGERTMNFVMLLVLPDIELCMLTFF